LYFAEPADLDPGQRVFHVAMQGKRVLKDFDIVQAAGGPRRLIVKEFRGVRVTDELTLSLTPSPQAPASRPVLCGVEIVAEE
ncbi:MAG: malectin domain-containing carbohydrate-binding protein, partial [Planctomycetota bacterium]